MSDAAASQQALPLVANEVFEPIDKALDPAQGGKYLSNVNGQDSQQPIDKSGQPLLVTEPPSSIALVSQATITVCAGRHLHGTAQADWHFAAGNVIAAAVAKDVSPFTQHSGIYAIAEGGPVSVQAHIDVLAVLADKAVTAISSVGSVEILARQNIVLHDGDLLIRPEGNAVTFETSGSLSAKGAEHPFEGPGGQVAALPVLPVGVLPPSTVLLEHTYHNGQGLTDVKYFAKLVDGLERQGILDSQGRAALENIPPGSVQVSYGPMSSAFERKDKTPMPNHDPNSSDSRLPKLADKYLPVSNTPTPSA